MTVQIFKLDILLTYSEPTIYRQVLVKSNMPLEKFHLVIQAAMGWYNCHMHQYSTEDGRVIATKDFDFEILPEEDLLDGRKLKLGDLLKKKDDVLLYIYDMGDNWDHEIILREILPVDKSLKYPICAGGALACPLEDSGGLEGYENIIEVLNDKSDPEHSHIAKWTKDLTGSSKYDPNRFDKSEANSRLAELRTA